MATVCREPAAAAGLTVAEPLLVAGTRQGRSHQVVGARRADRRRPPADAARLCTVTTSPTYPPATWSTQAGARTLRQCQHIVALSCYDLVLTSGRRASSSNWMSARRARGRGRGRAPLLLLPIVDVDVHAARSGGGSGVTPVPACTGPAQKINIPRQPRARGAPSTGRRRQQLFDDPSVIIRPRPAPTANRRPRRSQDNVERLLWVQQRQQRRRRARKRDAWCARDAGVCPHPDRTSSITIIRRWPSRPAAAGGGGDHQMSRHARLHAPRGRRCVRARGGAHAAAAAPQHDPNARQRAVTSGAGRGSGRRDDVVVLMME